MLSAHQPDIKLWKRLYALISTPNENELEINIILDEYTDKKELRNIINMHQHSENLSSERICGKGAITAAVATAGATLLMMAVWRLKKKTVEQLLKYGADVKYENMMGESVATSWDCGLIEQTEENEILAGEIAKLLHVADADLRKSSARTNNIVEKSKRLKLTTLQEELKLIGYY